MVKSSVFSAFVLAAALGAAQISSADDSQPVSPPAKDAARASCLKDTGSRLKSKDCAATASPGRSYSKEELDRTGKVTAGGDLRMLDPAITTGH
jgi:hypothetical protein